MYPLHRPRLVGVKAQYCALSWSTERNPMTIQVWCSIEVFHQSDARTIPAMVNTGGLTRDILRALHVRMADVGASGATGAAPSYWRERRRTSDRKSTRL